MNKHEVEWAAWNYYQNLDSHHMAEKKHCNNHTNAFEAGVEWAEKTLIDKASDWLIENFYNHPHEQYFICSEAFDCIEEMVEQFMKAMKAE